uniref:Odorant receptor n=1 Tax=Leucinodes orbonalis TaxID=711050 RepID=A0AAU0QJW6_9NEOP|nr:odorant receptor [Leucinodes orbonalis]
MFYYKVSVKELIDEISYDYLCYNNLPDRYQNVIYSRVNACMVYTERLWIITLGVAVGAFPLMAALTTLYSQIFDDIPKKYMVHDLNIPFTEPETRFESPYFEIMFFYLTGCAATWFINYACEYVLVYFDTNSHFIFFQTI